MKFASRCTLLFFMGIVFPLLIFARDIELIIEDTDLSIPLEGAIIRSWDGSEHIADADGMVRLTVPDDRPVVVFSAYSGYENGRHVLNLGQARYTIGLRLSGTLEGRELIIEAQKPGSSETKTGRSVGLSEKEIAQTAQIGIIEDVMTSVKLLPGVGYSGTFNALPSIRGGDPDDMTAVLDGFYVFNPYFWGGGFSIFDPGMVQSAQLSHGVFSSRYGNTISGLLEIRSKIPSSTETEFEFGLSLSAANVNLSLPISDKGGVMFMGRVTYYDPIIWAAKQLAKAMPSIDAVNSIHVAPYIRSGTITANYRFAPNFDLSLTGFWGSDGVGYLFEDESTDGDLRTDTTTKLDWVNHQGFLIAQVGYNPSNSMLLKATAGIGIDRAKMDANMGYDVNNPFSENFKTKFPSLIADIGESYDFLTKDEATEDISLLTAQGRIDYDWEIGKGFLFATGVQELFTKLDYENSQRMYIETAYSDLTAEEKTDFRTETGILPEIEALAGLHVGRYYKSPESSTKNKMFTSSAYILMEYASPGNRFGAELGLRVEHLYLTGKDVTVQSSPVFNPRLSLDYNILKNVGIIESLSATVGTGLFSSQNIMLNLIGDDFTNDDFDLKPNRSWTSVLGTKFEFQQNINLNIEGYYKHVYDRAYIATVPGVQSGEFLHELFFDGKGKVWGFDLMLQKLHSRYWDGWISYSFNYAQYRDPHGLDNDLPITAGGSSGDDWYFPSYHRFHNINLVANIRPKKQFNLNVRLGLASGIIIEETLGDPESYPVYIAENGDVIEKWRQETRYNENKRSTWSIPLDVKFSILGFNKKGKVQSEVYIAVENVLALLYAAKGNKTFNAYNGKEVEGGESAAYGIPIPIPSFGFKFSY